MTEVVDKNFALPIQNTVNNN